MPEVLFKEIDGYRLLGDSAVSIFIIVSIIVKDVAFDVAFRYFCNTAEGLWKPARTSFRSPRRVKVFENTERSFMKFSIKGNLRNIGE